MATECSVVVPLCNEEVNLPKLHLRLMATMCQLAIPYEIIYVDDGSTDNTPALMRELHQQDAHVKALFLSRNFGHQSALCAGIEVAAGRAVVTIDGDLQDPPELIPELIKKWHEGYQVVYAKRRQRKENPFKKIACFVFYRVLRRVSEIPIPLDTGDFALMDRQALEQLNNMPERTRFIRGLRSWVGFKQTCVEYDRDPRRDGVSKYPFSRLARLGLDGIFGFSEAPLKAITILGAVVSFLSLTTLGAAALSWAEVIGQLPGSLWIGSILGLLAGFQLVCLGIIGEYLARVHQEVRGRPLYVTREKLGFRTMPRPAPNVLEFFPDPATLQQESATEARIRGHDYAEVQTTRKS